MKKEMLINVSQPEECRIAIVEDGMLEELYVERASQDNYVGNIYKGRIVNLEPSIQAAFVDFGVGRNGFLHISDVEPQYFRQGGYDPSGAAFAGDSADTEFDDERDERDERGMDRGTDRGMDRDETDDDRGRGDRSRDHRGRDNRGRDERGRDERGGERGRRDRNGGRNGGPRYERGNRRTKPGARPRIKPPIQEIFRRGDEVLVQVIKEGIGAKGPTLSTYISIPGRYLVLMPALGRVGVSRKIEDEDARRRLRDAMLELNPPKGLGFIVRTAGQDRTKKELSRDLAYLLRLWKAIVRRVKKQPAPCDIYEESDMIIRTIRDIVTADVDAIHIDQESAYERAREFLSLVMPRFVDRLHWYSGKAPIFHHYKLEDDIARIHKRVVPLPDGGSIVIDQTEALVAIDVNSGSFRIQDNADETAYRLNLAAAKEISRQLRLRDLGGVIVNDFIDMRRERHRRGVEKTLRDLMKRDRARTKILRTSPFGLVEMTRQRIRPSIHRSVYTDCPCCKGRAVVKTPESMAIEVVRMLMLAGQQPGISKVTVKVNDGVASYLNNKKRREISRLEDEGSMTVQVNGVEGLFPEHLEIECRDADGREIKLPL